MEHKPPAPVIEAAHAEHLTTLPFDDTADFDDTDRGTRAELAQRAQHLDAGVALVIGFY